MAVEVRVPAVGESVKEGMIHKWHVKDGEYVNIDKVLLELETDKATVEAVAANAGAIKLLKKEGDTVAVGDVIAQIDESAAKPAGGAAEPAPAPQAKTSAPPPPPPPPAAASASSAPLSPAVQRMVSEQKLDPQQIPATGKGGRLTKGDVIEHVERQGQVPKAAPSATPAAPARTLSGDRQTTRKPMSMIRRRTAERLIQAQTNAAILTTFNEIDTTAVMKVRAQHKEGFKERYGTSLGFMTFFVKAAVEALRAFPLINGWIEGNEIVEHSYIDIGVAVSSDRGLVVPVLRGVDKLNFAETELAIANFAKRARDGKITVDELTGGNFTVSNGGVFGSLMSTPILNPPQSAILGMHKTQERPIVVDGQIVIRPMMYVALSYDHRIVDGREAVQFLVKIKECVEDPARLLIGV